MAQLFLNGTKYKQVRCTQCSSMFSIFQMTGPKIYGLQFWVSIWNLLCKIDTSNVYVAMINHTFLAYGISTHSPVLPSNVQLWKGHVIQSPLTLPPDPKLAPRCGQYKSVTCIVKGVLEPRKTAKCSPSACTSLTIPLVI